MNYKKFTTSFLVFTIVFFLFTNIIYCQEKVAKKVDEILAGVHTGRDVNRAIEEVAAATGKSGSEVRDTGNNILMQQEALARPEIAKKTYEEADKAVVASF